MKDFDDKNIDDNESGAPRQGPRLTLGSPKASGLGNLTRCIELGCNEECHEGAPVQWGEKNMIDLDDDE